MIKSCLIKKYPNKAGNYSCQYVEENKIKICCFKTYEDAITTAYLIWNLTKETHLQNSIILEKE